MAVWLYTGDYKQYSYCEFYKNMISLSVSLQGFRFLLCVSLFFKALFLQGLFTFITARYRAVKLSVPFLSFECRAIEMVKDY